MKVTNVEAWDKPYEVVEVTVKANAQEVEQLREFAKKSGLQGQVTEHKGWFGKKSYSVRLYEATGTRTAKARFALDAFAKQAS